MATKTKKITSVRKGDIYETNSGQLIEVTNGRLQDEHPANAKLSNEVGTLSMANTGQPNSGSCQFFINTAHNHYLDFFTPGPSKHPVFGRVTQGMDVLKKIETTPTDGGDRPITPVKMNKITISGA